jgi:hypothetical protein
VRYITYGYTNLRRINYVLVNAPCNTKFRYNKTYKKIPRIEFIIGRLLVVCIDYGITGSLFSMQNKECGLGMLLLTLNITRSKTTTAMRSRYLDLARLEWSPASAESLPLVFVPDIVSSNWLRRRVMASEMARVAGGRYITRPDIPLFQVSRALHRRRDFLHSKF